MGFVKNVQDSGGLVLSHSVPCIVVPSAQISVWIVASASYGSSDAVKA